MNDDTERQLRVMTAMMSTESSLFVSVTIASPLIFILRQLSGGRVFASLQSSSVAVAVGRTDEEGGRGEKKAKGGKKE